jgi:hypothetical protein
VGEKTARTASALRGAKAAAFLINTFATLLSAADARRGAERDLCSLMNGRV